MCEGRISTLLPSTESATLHRVSEVFRDDHREASDRVGAKRPGAQSTGFAVNLHVLSLVCFACSLPAMSAGILLAHLDNLND